MRKIEGLMAVNLGISQYFYILTLKDKVLQCGDSTICRVSLGRNASDLHFIHHLFGERKF